MRVAIIADDLTGSTDSASQFAQRKLKALTLLPAAICEINERKDDCEVMVLDCESRNLDTDLCYETVKQAAQTALEVNPKILLFKKVDSTMRGHVGVEIKACMDAYEGCFTIFAPAFAANGRTTLGGMVFVNGVKIDNLETATFSKRHVTNAFLPELINEEVEFKSALISLDLLLQGSEAICSYINEQRALGVEIFICDSLNDGHLDVVVQAASSFDRVLYCGAAGLAGALARHLSKDNAQKPALKLDKVLVVSGAVSQISRNQTVYLLNETDPVVARIDISTAVSEPNLAAIECIEKIRGNLSTNEHLYVICSALYPEDVHDCYKAAAKLGMGEFESGQCMTKVIGQALKDLAHEFEAFVITGGDVAVKSLMAMDAKVLEVLFDLNAAGMPLCKIAAGPHLGKYLVTKAGTFGDDNCFIDAVRELHQ